MHSVTNSLDLTKQDLDVIEAALETQEKILSLQTRAGGKTARNKLSEIKGLLRRLRRQNQAEPDNNKNSWAMSARSLFCI